jgi:8-amino-7-oxononanoate synthase
VIYLDDAHGLGILGRGAQEYPPYGHGGGGTPLAQNISPGNIIHVASLSKALGVPLAFAAGPERFIYYLKRAAPSFVHSSQPALPVVAAAIGALHANKMEGDELRQRLARRVAQFIRGFQNLGIHIPVNECFPIQSLYFRSAKTALRTAMQLRKNGIWSLLQVAPLDFQSGGALRFVISVDHTEGQVQQLHDLIPMCVSGDGMMWSSAHRSKRISYARER